MLNWIIYSNTDQSTSDDSYNLEQVFHDTELNTLPPIPHIVIQTTCTTGGSEVKYWIWYGTVHSSTNERKCGTNKFMQTFVPSYSLHLAQCWVKWRTCPLGVSPASEENYLEVQAGSELKVVRFAQTTSLNSFCHPHKVYTLTFVDIHTKKKVWILSWSHPWLWPNVHIKACNTLLTHKKLNA